LIKLFSLLNVPSVAIYFHAKELSDTVLCERSSNTYKSFSNVCQKL
jgi:hypothetical protein